MPTFATKMDEKEKERLEKLRSKAKDYFLQKEGKRLTHKDLEILAWNKLMETELGMNDINMDKKGTTLKERIDHFEYGQWNKYELVHFLLKRNPNTLNDLYHDFLNYVFPNISEIAEKFYSLKGYSEAHNFEIEYLKFEKEKRDKWNKEDSKEISEKIVKKNMEEYYGKK